MRQTDDPQVDEYSDGYRYNGEHPWLLPIEPPESQPVPSTKSREKEANPVARKFDETEAFLITIDAPRDNEVFRLPINLPKPRVSRLDLCYKCSSPRTHRHHEGGRALRYVCTEHAKEAQAEGFQVFGPPLE